MKFSLFFLPSNKNSKASTSEITASKQAKQLLQLVFFFWGGGYRNRFKEGTFFVSTRFTYGSEC